MKNLKLYRVIRFMGSPESVLVFAPDRKKGKEYSDKKYGPVIYSEVEHIKVKSGLVLEEARRR